MNEQMSERLTSTEPVFKRKENAIALLMDSRTNAIECNTSTSTVCQVVASLGLENFLLKEKINLDELTMCASSSRKYVDLIDVPFKQYWTNVEYLQILCYSSWNKIKNIYIRSKLIYPEYYLLGQMGNIEKTLNIIIHKLQSIETGIDFCKEHDDSDLRNLLIVESIETPEILGWLNRTSLPRLLHIFEELWHTASITCGVYIGCKPFELNKKPNNSKWEPRNNEYILIDTNIEEHMQFEIKSEYKNLEDANEVGDEIVISEDTKNDIKTNITDENNNIDNCDKVQVEIEESL
uniref:Uncharacterized protein n=1 Tax=Glossina austeni TaxID=7395 RepID=A0A1A9UQT5_GLOAU